MYKMIPWSKSLDLLAFYETANKKGYYNNSTQKMLVDAFNNETEKQVWILYYNDIAVGSVAAHSFTDVMGDNSYRIAVRTCAFTDHLPIQHLRTKTGIITHQHVAAQFLIPTCIEWAGMSNKMFITSNNLTVGTQRLVHNIYFPALEQRQIVSRIKEVDYRGTTQTVWQLFPDKFLEDLNLYPRWK